MLKNSTPREWRRQNSPIRNRKGDNKMNKRDFSSYEKQIDEIVFSIYGISEIEKSFLNHTSKIEDNSSLVNG